LGGNITGEEVFVMEKSCFVRSMDWFFKHYFEELGLQREKHSLFLSFRLFISSIILPTEIKWKSRPLALPSKPVYFFLNFSWTRESHDGQRHKQYNTQTDATSFCCCWRPSPFLASTSNRWSVVCAPDAAKHGLCHATPSTLPGNTTTLHNLATTSCNSTELAYTFSTGSTCASAYSFTLLLFISS
jgi:hypothetical protein